jgi:hypothetical protein
MTNVSAYTASIAIQFPREALLDQPVVDTLPINVNSPNAATKLPPIEPFGMKHTFGSLTQKLVQALSDEFASPRLNSTHLWSVNSRQSNRNLNSHGKPQVDLEHPSIAVNDSQDFSVACVVVFEHLAFLVPYMMSGTRSKINRRAQVRALL